MLLLMMRVNENTRGGEWNGRCSPVTMIIKTVTAAMKPTNENGRGCITHVGMRVEYLMIDEHRAHSHPYFHRRRLYVSRHSSAILVITIMIIIIIIIIIIVSTAMCRTYSTALI